MQDIMILQPVFQKRIWGGRKLQTWFPNEHLGTDIGECWSVSAHPNGMSKITNGTYKEQNLATVYEQHPELFGYPQQKVFPLLVKILDASADLSVQVHPDDAYAARVEHELGKTECWYMLDCEPNAKIIYGHNAKTKEEFASLVEGQHWHQLLREQPVHKNEFFYVPSGTIHALCAGTLVLEVQQSSDTTYRLYDYDRLDDQGQKRELHLEKSLAVTTIPHTEIKVDSTMRQDGKATITQLIQNKFFTVEKISINGTYCYQRDADYINATIIAGEATVAGHKLSKGQSFIIPHTMQEVICDGDFEMIVSHV